MYTVPEVQFDFMSIPEIRTQIRHPRNKKLRTGLLHRYERSIQSNDFTPGLALLSRPGLTTSWNDSLSLEGGYDRAAEPLSLHRWRRCMASTVLVIFSSNVCLFSLRVQLDAHRWSVWEEKHS